MQEARERLLDGFARRLAVARDADAYALRGGMLVRSWAVAREVRDLDLVCALPYRPRDLRGRVADILATTIADGVRFDERFRIDAMNPVLVVYATGEADGVAAEITVDLTFELEVWPRATRRLVGDAELWTCPHEMVIATKLGLIGELGPRAWRTKDLADVWVASRRFDPSVQLGEAIERRDLDLHALLTPSGWRTPEAASRWARATARTPWLPFDLAGVIDEVRRYLSPFARAA